MLSNEKVLATIVVMHELKKFKYECESRKKIIYRKKTTSRRYWVKPLLLRRTEHDIEAHLLKDLLWEDDERDFKNFSRLNVHQFEEILNMVCGKLKKVDTCMRAAIPPRTKLAITLRYLATGDSFKSLEFLTRVSSNTIGSFIPFVLRAIYDAFKDVYLKIPDTNEDWKKIADDFQYIWQFPHTLGALDGKHIRIKAPPNSGTQFYNFKGFFSIVLFALVDAHGRFTFIDVGCNGKASDSTIFQDGWLCNALEKKQLNIPKDKQLGLADENRIPYFFIGDDAFRLDNHLMKPYSRSLKLTVQQEIFNYRLCRARMVVECAFGKLAKRFNIFNRPIEVLPSTVDLVVMTSCLLHNFLTKIRTTPMSSDFECETPPQTFSSIGQQENKYYKYACRIRDTISKYLVTDGDVDFQWGKINISH